MQDWFQWSAQSDSKFSQRKVVAFDLDDTLTTHGELQAEVIQELAQAQKRNWVTVLVTGRACAWADAIIKLLPFDAVVSENGAVIYYWENLRRSRGPREEPKRLYWSQGIYQKKAPTGLDPRKEETAKKILAQVPGSRVASDQIFRLYDLAIDFAEEVDPPLPLSQANRIKDIFEAQGATAKVSSIHVNGWWGAFTKKDGLQYLLESTWGWNLKDSLIYVGDSPNDAPLFELAEISVGVANVKSFVDAGISFSQPVYVTRQESGAGSCEVLRALPLQNPL